jgi:hypothetical protein
VERFSGKVLAESTGRGGGFQRAKKPHSPTPQTQVLSEPRRLKRQVEKEVPHFLFRKTSLPKQEKRRKFNGRN